jgi:hypothetical protein
MADNRIHWEERSALKPSAVAQIVGNWFSLMTIWDGLDMWCDLGMTLYGCYSWFMDRALLEHNCCE